MFGKPFAGQFDTVEKDIESGKINMDEKKKEEQKTAEALLAEKAADKEVSFAPGAIDGIYIYHTTHKQGPAEELIEAIRILHEEGEDEAEKKLYQVFVRPRETRMISMIDQLQHHIIDNVDKYSPEKLLSLASRSISSANTEIVKFGLSLMELVNFSESEDFRSVVVTLAKDEEFTLFALYVIRAWKDGAYITFGLAKRLLGWGRIHAVHFLTPETQEMKDWLIREGWYNEVIPAYSALDAAEKGELMKFLEKDTFSDEDVKGVEGLVEALLDEGPVRGISVYPEKDALVKRLTELRAGGAFTEKTDQFLGAMKGSKA